MPGIPDRPLSHAFHWRRLAACVAVLCVLASVRAASPGDPLDAPRAEFQLAYGRIADAATAIADSAALRGYILYPYLQAARMSQSLGVADTNVPASMDEQIATFLRAHDAEPVAQDLHRTWLASLAARGRWQQFLAFHRETTASAEQRCQGFTARIELQRTEGLVANITLAWLTPRSLPECERAFEWLRSSGGLSEALIEQRARLALEAGNAAFARQMAAQLPAARAAPLLQWAALQENPRREIDSLVDAPGTVVETPALLDGWTRLARSDQAAAAQRFDKLLRARKLDPAAASPFALALALPMSWNRSADALKYFARARSADFDDYAFEWQARAALWAGDWSKVSLSIAAMSAETARTARWRYWAARAAAHNGKNEAASRLYESILAEDNYYSAMAAARLKRAIAPHAQALLPDAAQLASIGNQSPFVRARELRLAGLVNNAQAEWRSGLDALPAAMRAQSVHLAAGWGWYDQAITTATSERVFNDYSLLYPRPYDTDVAVAAGLSGLPPDLVYGVIRQESLYRRDAVSGADARGLMQLLPETARRTARQWQQPAPTDAMLSEPSVNIVLGAAHLKDLLDRFGGQLPLALASYNAGPGAVQRWLPARQMDPDIWIENIPYNETRVYVQRILWHTVVFGWLRMPTPRNTREWLSPIKAAATRSAMPVRP